MIKEIVKKNRSYRRFWEERKIELNELEQLVELARYSGSGANLQPLKYILSCDEEKNSKIFPSLKWAGYLKDWNGPLEGERPTGYIVIVGDKNVSKIFGVDPGIVMQSMLLGAVEIGLGGCMFGSINREELKENLKLPDEYEILYVLALGKPKEEVVVEDAKESIKYYRDEDSVHHVPKRKMEELILNL